TFVFRFVTLHGKGNASSQRSLSRRPIWLDVHAVVAVAVAIACVLGLLVCGSRAGLVAIAVGAITTFAWFRRGHGWKTIPMVLCLFLLTVVAGVLLLSPLASRFRSVERFNRIDIRSSEGLSGDVRFQHWRDGLRAAKYYLPAGSGLSTYGYAYLPYQQHGAGLSFHHADNLWLELLVEQGLVGLAFAAWAIGLLVWSLHRLSRSGDPLDVGLQVAGWYFLGAMLWSQCFDFGLVLPGNLITTMVFIAMLFSRSLTVVNDQSKRASTQGLVFIKAPQRLLATLTGSLIALSGFLSLQPLKADAFLDATISDAKQILESSPADEDSIASRVERLKALASDDPRATLLDLASDLDRQLGRLESTRRIASTRELPFADAYTQAKSSSLRRAWRANQRQAFPETEGYLQAVASSTQSLLRAPLGVRPRANLVQLDFAHRDDQISLSALRQLSVLQSQSPEQLVRLGKLAFDSDERGLSAELWKRATQLDPKLATDAVKFTRATPELVVDQFLDASSQSQLLASMQLLKMPGESVAEKTQAEEFFQLAVERLDCEAYSTIRQRGECYHVTGDILYRLRRFDESFERYAQAILLNPANTRLRFKVIARLCSTDRLEDAIRLAKKSQQDFPEVSRFGTLGSQIEQQSRAESENSQD
ncbi:MAG: O-antigen ligase family protein, partial [Planctomycetota bacterium]